MVDSRIKTGIYKNKYLALASNSIRKVTNPQTAIKRIAMLRDGTFLENAAKGIPNSTKIQKTGPWFCIVKSIFPQE